MAYGGEGGVMIRMGCRVEVVLTGGLRHFDPTVCILSIIAFFFEYFCLRQGFINVFASAVPQFPFFCIAWMSVCVFAV